MEHVECQHHVKHAVWEGKGLGVRLAERNGGRVAPVFATDAELKIGAGGAPTFNRHSHQRAHAFLIEGRKWIEVEDVVGRFSVMKAACATGHRLLVHVRTQTAGATVPAVHIEADELRRIVAREPEGRLGQVVRAERKELGCLGDVGRR